MHYLRPAGVTLALIAFLSATGSAQTSRGTVTGVVTDVTKAAVSGAGIDLVNKDTNVVRTTSTNEAGVYRFDAVDPGTYDVTVKGQGFKTYTSRAITVSAAQTAGVDAQLEVGDNVSVVEVTSDSIALQTEAPVRGGTINTTQATLLPVFSRNPNLLAVTLPGVTEQRSDLPGVATFSVNGSRGRSNNFLLDGTENNDISVAGQGFQVKIPEAVQEVSVQTANYDAEFGRAGGAVVNTITKSGTNEFHGTLSWVADFSNDDAITNTLSTSPEIQARGALPPGYQQYYNGTFGGPIVKDRTFFFTAWQEQRDRASNTAPFIVPSALGRQQIRSAFPAGSNLRADRYLDITSNVIASGSQQFSNIDMGSGRGNAQFGTGIVSFPSRIDGRQSLSKVDHRFSDNDLLSVRFGFDRTINPFASINFADFVTSSTQRYFNALITETHIFSPTLTNEFRLPYNRLELDSPNNPANSLGQILPATTIAGLTNPIAGAISYGVSANFPQGRIANNYGLQDTMSLVRGKHTLRFGLDLLKQRSRQFAPAAFRGTLMYGGSNISGVSYTGFANYLDDFGGAANSSRDFGSAAYYPTLFRQAYFFTDRWQIRSNVTLTLGVRYEDFGTPANSLRTPAYAGIFNATVNPNGTVTAPYSLPNQTEHDLNNFSPSVGLTFSPRLQQGWLARIFGDGKSVIRTGYNMGYDSFFNNIASNAATSTPNLISTQLVSQVTTANPRGEPNLSQKLPTVPRDPLPIDAQTLVVKNLRNPYMQKWSFGIQRELPWGMVLDSSYVGTAGVGLFLNEDLNPTVLNPVLRVLPAGYSSLPQLQSAVTSYTLSTRLDPLQGSRQIRTNGGHSTYHSGQFQLTKRFSRDLGFNIAYTVSKLLDNGSEIFTFNNTSSLAAIPSVFGGQGLEKAVSLYDRPYRLVLTYYYQLPFLRTQRGALGRVLGGWAVSGITTFESGVPFNVSNGADSDALGGAGERPDFNPAGQAGVRARPVSQTEYVNPDVLDAAGQPVPINRSEARYIGLLACTAATNFQNCRAGNAPRNAERTPGIRNTSLNAFKSFRLAERFTLEIRGEMYNVFNHPQYGYPSVSPFTPSAGTPLGNVTTAPAGRFLNYTILDAGGRTVRYNLTLRF